MTKKQKACLKKGKELIATENELLGEMAQWERERKRREKNRLGKRQTMFYFHMRVLKAHVVVGSEANRLSFFCYRRQEWILEWMMSSGMRKRCNIVPLPPLPPK